MTNKSRVFAGEMISFCIFFFLLLGLAHGQSVGTSVQAVYTNSVVMAEHPQHARVHALDAEQSLLDGIVNTSAHGERPLWECYSSRTERPLGDVAREYRTAWMHPVKKATVTLEK